MALNYVTLVLDLADGSGSPVTKGTATLSPSVQLTDSADGMDVVAPVTASFRQGSYPQVRLLATDNTGPQPAGWGWTISFSGVPGNPASFSFFLPFASGATQHLSALSPVSSAVTMQAYLPLPSGTPSSGQVPVATGSGEASAWGPVLPTTTLGDTVYGGASGVPARLAGSTVSRRKVYTQTGTGSASAAPAWQEPATDWANVIDFGADPTGANDSTTAIQNAINAGFAYIPRGTYKLTAALTAAGGNSIVGDGYAATVLNQTSTTANGISFVSAAAFNDIRVEGLTINGPGSGTGLGIFASAAGGGGVITNMYMRDVKVIGMGSHGVYTQNLIISLIEECWARQNGGEGFWFSAASGSNFNACFANFNARHGFYFTQGQISSITNCGSDENSIGYELFQCNNVAIEACDAFGTGAANGLDGSSFKINNSTLCAVREGHSYGNAAIACYITGTSALNTVENFLEDNHQAGATASIQVDAGSSAIVGNVTAQSPQVLNGAVLTLTPAGVKISGGGIDVAKVGSGLSVAEGTNAKQGTATLAAGAVTVANTSVTATSRIFLTAQDNSTTGSLRVSARTAGTSFMITSSNAGDSGVVAYEIFEPG